MTLKPYHMRFTAGPLAGKTLRVLATDPLDAAGIVGRELREHALDTSHPVYAPTGTLDMFGDAPAEVDTITLDEAREALNADAS